MTFKYTMTAEPYFKLVKKGSKSIKQLAGFYPIYKKKLGEIQIWRVKASQLQKTEAEAKAFAKERLTSLLTKGGRVKFKHAKHEKMVQVYATRLNPETGQIERRCY